MNDIKQNYQIDATPKEVWRALTEPRIIEEWSESSAIFPLQVGAAYSLWEGSIGGEIVEFVPMQKLVQTWKPQDWLRTDSIVTFMLMPQESGTRVDLHHVNIEESDFDGTTEGWDMYYLGAIKRMFETQKPKRASAKKAAAKKKPAKRKAVKKVATKKPVKKKSTTKKAKKKYQSSARFPYGNGRLLCIQRRATI
ncbi:MAG TPA: SRPBCC domain-containing protein [Anaerolineae bacterium]